MKITIDSILKVEHEQSPKLFFEIGRDALLAVEKLKDEQGRYLWRPDPDSAAYPGYLLGRAIKRVEGNGVRLLTAVHDKCNVVNLQDL